MDLQCARGRRYFVHIHVVLLALMCVSTEGFGSKSTPGDPSDKELVTKSVAVQYASYIVFEGIGVDA